MSKVGQLADTLLARLVPHTPANACAIAFKVSGGVAAETCTSKRARYICTCFSRPDCYGGWRFYNCA